MVEINIFLLPNHLLQLPNPSLRLKFQEINKKREKYVIGVYLL